MATPTKLKVTIDVNSADVERVMAAFVRADNNPDLVALTDPAAVLISHEPIPAGDVSRVGRRKLPPGFPAWSQTPQVWFWLMRTRGAQGGEGTQITNEFKSPRW